MAIGVVLGAERMPGFGVVKVPPASHILSSYAFRNLGRWFGYTAVRNLPDECRFLTTAKRPVCAITHNSRLRRCHGNVDCRSMHHVLEGLFAASLPGSGGVQESFQ